MPYASIEYNCNLKQAGVICRRKNVAYINGAIDNIM